MHRTCTSCRGQGSIERGPSMQGLAGGPALSVGPCPTCHGHALVLDLADTLGALLSTAYEQQRRAPSEPLRAAWADLGCACAALAQAARVVPAVPAAVDNPVHALQQVRRELGDLPVREPDETGRGALWNAALHMAARALARLSASPAGVEAVATTRAEGRA